MNEQIRQLRHYQAIKARLNSGKGERWEPRVILRFDEDAADVAFDWDKIQLSILDEVCAEFSLERCDILAPRDPRDNFDARLTLYMRFYRELSMNYEEIADLIGRDRSSVRRLIQRNLDMPDITIQKRFPW
jgi:hypothetical protein